MFDGKILVNSNLTIDKTMYVCMYIIEYLMGKIELLINRHIHQNFPHQIFVVYGNCLFLEMVHCFISCAPLT